MTWTWIALSAFSLLLVVWLNWNRVQLLKRRFGLLIVACELAVVVAVTVMEPLPGTALDNVPTMIISLGNLFYALFRWPKSEKATASPS